MGVHPQLAADRVLLAQLGEGFTPACPSVSS